MAAPHVRRSLYAVFFVSGFSGLMYESLWTHYLKLFLGHAAYAQALVLAIFMGGLALGSWASGRLVGRVDRVLMAYATAEALVGLLALGFHPIFTAVTGPVYAAMAPGVGSGVTAHLARGGLAAALILPQTFLLGTTFPFMSAGVLRRSPGRPGAVLSTLYFVNSLGGVGGVLAAAFVFVPWLGLPGSLRFAGVLNLAAAAWVVALVAGRTEDREASAVPPTAEARAPVRLLLAAALVTGLTSFVYEVAWLRLLALVLGSSTHAFEIMLSAFILGLALGGVWIRNRADRFSTPLRTLAVIQLAMGLAAVATLPLYVESYSAVGWLLGELPRTGLGYALYGVASYTVAAGIMLPATFCAGMTLPLITLILFRGGLGERSLGAVYGVNTVGAILGVFLAVFVGFETLGLKNLLVAGAAVDVLLGVALIAAGSGERRHLLGAGAAILAGLASVALTKLDPALLSAGGFLSRTEDAVEVIDYADGRTASIAITRAANGWLTLRTNGKPDASLAPFDQAPTSDEATQVLLGALPLLHRPDAARAAVIGLGAGVSSHVLLASPSVREVVTIEIEARVVDLARHFRPHNERVFSDPRSRIVIDDAKGFFSGAGTRFDVVVSEPSNTWVSGVAGLYSREFYRHLKARLTDDGVLVQWLHAYELDEALLASVLGALGSEFADYAVYGVASSQDYLIVATPARDLPPLAAAAPPALASALERVGVAGPAGVAARRLARRRTLEPWLRAVGAPANSDYRPYLDLHANQARFYRSSAGALFELTAEQLPVDDLLGGAEPSGAVRAGHAPGVGASLGAALREALAAPATAAADPAGEQMRGLLALCRDREADPVEPLLAIGYGGLLFLPRGDAEALWPSLVSEPCAARLVAEGSEWPALLLAVVQRDREALSRLPERLLDAGAARNDAYTRALVSAGMLGHLASGRRDEAARLWSTYGGQLSPFQHNFLFRLLLAHTFN